jgi:hypothetical protein
VSYGDQHGPDTLPPPDEDPSGGTPRSRAQFFVPAPEDLPPAEEVFGPGRRRTAGAIPDPADRRDVAGSVGAGGESHEPHGYDAAGARGGPASYAPDPAPEAPGGLGGPAASYGGGIPDRPASYEAGPGGLDEAGSSFGGGIPEAPVLDGRPHDPYGAEDVPEPRTFDSRSVVVPPPAPDLAVDDGIPDAPVLDPRARPREPEPVRPGARGPRSGERPRRSGIDRRRLAVVYDIDGPRVRLGVAWFLVALVATLSPVVLVAAVVYGAAAGLAARQLVRAWGSVPWQADVAAGIGAVPVLAALIGTNAVIWACALGVVVAVGCSLAPDGARLPGGGGRAAAAGIMCFSLVPAAGAASFVLVRSHSIVAAVVLLVIVSAYEVGDFIVGSGGSTPIEGPLAGITSATLLALPLSLVLVEPYDTGGVALLAFTALACPLGQLMASAVLPGAAAPAPALRRIDTLLVLAPLWAATAGAF